MQLSNTLESVVPNSFIRESIGNRVEALRAVMMLMLREVESIEKAIEITVKMPMESNDYRLSEKLEQLEIDMIRCALIKTNGRQKPAAAMLGMKLTTLNAKMKKYEIDWRVPIAAADLTA
jgi:DNA-binding NtrC family response regulator